MASSDLLKTLPDVGLAKSVRESWERELLVDYTIQVEDKQFKVHKLIMASVSDYFKAMLTGGMMESRSDTARLEGFSPLAVQNIIEYIYTNEISGPKASAKEFLACAMYLQIPQAVEAATKLLMNKINTQNCFEVACTFKMYSLNKAVQQTKEYIKSNIDQIQKDYQIQKLPLEYFQIFCEVWEGSEWDLFVVIEDWVMTDYENCKQHLKSLMSQIQFGVMSAAELESVKSVDIYSDESWHELVEAAEEYRNLPTHRKMLQTFRVQGKPSVLCFCPNGINVFSVMQEVGDEEQFRMSPTIPHFHGDIAASVEFNNFLLVCESYSSNQRWHVFDARILEWSTMAKMLTPKTDFALVHDGKESVYALGGRVNVGSDTESVTDLIEKYDIKTNTWSVLPTHLPFPLQRHCACLCFGSIYVAGGWQTADTLQPWSKTMECYDPATNSWETKMPLTFPGPCRVIHLLELDSEQVIVLLGERLTFQCYNPKTHIWTVWRYRTKVYNDLEFHQQSKVLVSPRENALYLLNIYHDIESDVEDEDEPRELYLGGCLKWTLCKDARDIEEVGLQDFPLRIDPYSDQALYIAAVLNIPPEVATPLPRSRWYNLRK